MEADVGGAVDAVGKEESIIGLAPILRKGKIALPQPEKVPLLDPSGDVVPVKMGKTCAYVTTIKTRQIKHFTPELKKIHLFLFL
jgi:hypothetical protein